MAAESPAPMPGRSYYGFVAYVFGWAAILCYLVWAWVPHTTLAAVGITYVPHQLWAIVFPTLFITALVTFIFFVYPTINWMLTIPMDDIRNIQDGKSISVEAYENSEYLRGGATSPGSGDILPDDLIPVPPVYDMDISHVSRVLYS